MTYEPDSVLGDRLICELQLCFKCMLDQLTQCIPEVVAYVDTLSASLLLAIRVYVCSFMFPPFFFLTRIIHFSCRMAIWNHSRWVVATITSGLLALAGLSAHSVYSARFFLIVFLHIADACFR